VILLSRDIDKWHESYNDTVGAYFMSYQRRYMSPWSIQRYLMPKWNVGQLFECYFKYCNEASMPSRGKKMYEDQVARVRNLVGNKENLLEFDVKQGWEPLCKFLDKEVPANKPFPHIMERAEFRETSGNVRIYELILMGTNVAKWLAIAMTCAGGWWIGQRRGWFG
jgi:hypothetical protein